MAMRTSNNIVQCILTVSLLTLSTVAEAGDGKRYIGAFCTFYNDDNSGQDRSPLKFQNTSGATQTVICPILQETIDGDIEDAYIVATDTMDEDTCVLRERAEDASTQSWIHDAVASSGGGMNRTSWFSGTTWAIASNNATFAITCDLPNNVAVATYYFEDH